MKILRVAPDSAAARAGVRAGDDLLSVSGERIRDALDFLFAASEDLLTLELGRGAARAVRVEIARSPAEPLGIELAPDPIRRCANRCLFCFIDQNPKGLRRSLYVKDEDFRHSLLYGNYLTLTNLREPDLARIIAQRLSPLYISVHATDAAVRRRLLGCRGGGAILPLLERLTSGGIDLHAQVVVVPRHNDGAVLDRTLADLERLHPRLRSVAIVPVGLTRHRAALPRLRLSTAAEAGRVVRAVSLRQRSCRRRLGTRLHFLADEFYFVAGSRLPAPAAYEGYPQIENGVGMVRRFEEDFAAARRLIPALPGEGAGRPGARRATAPGRGARGARARVVIATGVRFAPTLARWCAAKLSATGESRRYRVEVIGVRNAFFGPRVTTAGLLSGGDLLAALRAAQPFDLALLPPETLNAEGRMLDDATPGELERELGAPVRVGFAGSAGDAGGGVGR